MSRQLLVFKEVWFYSWVPQQRVSLSLGLISATALVLTEVNNHAWNHSLYSEMKMSAVIRSLFNTVMQACNTTECTWMPFFNSKSREPFAAWLFPKGNIYIYVICWIVKSLFYVRMQQLAPFLKGLFEQKVEAEGQVHAREPSSCISIIILLFQIGFIIIIIDEFHIAITVFIVVKILECNSRLK